MATHGFETEKIALSEYRVNPCLGHDACSSFLTCRQDDDAHWILDKFASADGVILGSPVYYYDITAQMKAFVDRNYFLYTHGILVKARCAGLVVVAGAEGIVYAVDSLKRFIKSSTDIPDAKIFTVTGCANRLGDIKINSALVKEARQMGERMAKILAAVRDS